MILEVIYTLFIALAIYVLIEYLIHLSRLSNFPSGPFPLPVIGNLHQLGHKPHEGLKRLSKKYGDVFSLSIGSQRIVAVNSLGATREALIQRGDAFSGRPQDVYTGAIFSRNYQNIGFSDYGPRMKLMRKITHSSLKLHANRFKNLEDSILLEVNALFKRYDDKTGIPIEPHKDLGEF